jgi:hypothetical protein
MNSETRNCRNCKKDFIINPDDFDFYSKVKVPPPTWCPECRFKRRMVWRNDWHLFRKKEERAGEEIFSFIPAESPIKIYDRDYWISDAWDPMEFGRDYDFRRPFFEQYRELMLAVPLPAHSMINMVNCQFCTNANNCKNCYLVRGASYAEDSAYLIWDGYSKQCMDSHMTNKCELSYGNVNVTNSYKTIFSVDCENCQSVTLCQDCLGCNNCFGSFGLRNKSNYIFNELYSKEEYLEKIKSFNLDSWESLKNLKKEACVNWLKYPHKYIHGWQNVNVSGDYISESKNTKNSFRVKGCEDCKYCQNMLAGSIKDCYDFANFGEGVELIYESLVIGLQCSRVKFSTQGYPSLKDSEYTIFCSSSSDLFGCIGLRKKQYCIFNKQYSKEEYLALVPKITEHMNAAPFVDIRGREYRYGEFFPPELSPFPYRVTAAYEFSPLTEDEARAEGFNWYETARQSYVPTLRSNDIPDDIKDADDGILKEIIECSHKENCREECTGAFRIIPQELQFLKQLGLPLPRLCPNCRHGERLLLRNGPEFWKRTCMCAGAGSQKSQNAGEEYENVAEHSHGGQSCLNEFETSYPPESPVLVYCESCYQLEVA